MKNIHRHPNSISGSSGAAAVEFGLILVPFLIIIFGIIQVAYTFFLLSNLNEVATVTARTIQLTITESAPTVTVVQKEALSNIKGLDPNRLTIGLEPMPKGYLLMLTYNVPVFLPIFDWSVTEVRSNAIILP